MAVEAQPVPAMVFDYSDRLVGQLAAAAVEFVVADRPVCSERWELSLEEQRPQQLLGQLEPPLPLVRYFDSVAELPLLPLAAAAVVFAADAAGDCRHTVAGKCSLPAAGGIEADRRRRGAERPPGAGVARWRLLAAAWRTDARARWSSAAGYGVGDAADAKSDGSLFVRMLQKLIKNVGFIW